eukprot:PhM_4_TR17220/c0_g1_i1/m.101278
MYVHGCLSQGSARLVGLHKLELLLFFHSVDLHAPRTGVVLQEMCELNAVSLFGKRCDGICHVHVRLHPRGVIRCAQPRRHEVVGVAEGHLVVVLSVVGNKHWGQRVLDETLELIRSRHLVQLAGDTPEHKSHELIELQFTLQHAGLRYGRLGHSDLSAAPRCRPDLVEAVVASTVDLISYVVPLLKVCPTTCRHDCPRFQSVDRLLAEFIEHRAHEVAHVLCHWVSYVVEGQAQRAVVLLGPCPAVRADLHNRRPKLMHSQPQRRVGCVGAVVHGHHGHRVAQQLAERSCRRYDERYGRRP